MVEAAIPQAARRIAALDIARTVALIGMAVYHFTFDLEMFGWLAPGTVLGGPMRYFAMLVAGSFLFLAGISLHLAHGSGFRRRAFLRRLAVIVAAAALITVATRVWAPEVYIFFGILHSIAVASIIGLLFLRAPVWVTALAAVAVFAAPVYLRAELFDAPWLLWVGLHTTPVATLDFEPVLPWVGPFLLGMVAGRVLDRAGTWDRLRHASEGRVAWILGWPGRYSLAVYLVHQPVLVSLVWMATQMLR